MHYAVRVVQSLQAYIVFWLCQCFSIHWSDNFELWSWKVQKGMDDEKLCQPSTNQNVIVYEAYANRDARQKADIRNPYKTQLMWLQLNVDGKVRELILMNINEFSWWIGEILIVSNNVIHIIYMCSVGFSQTNFIIISTKYGFVRRWFRNSQSNNVTKQADVVCVRWLIILYVYCVIEIAEEMQIQNVLYYNECFGENDGN